MKQFYLTLIALLCCIHISTGQSNDLETIKSYLASTSRNSEDIKNIIIKNSSFSKSMQVTNAYVSQLYNGIPIRNVVGNFAIRNNKVLYFKGNFVEDIAAKATATDPVLSPEEALRKASAALELGNVSYEKVLQKKSNESYIITKSNISNDDIPITLVYEVVENQLVLSWDMSILTKDHQNWYSVRINAITGKLVSKDNLMLHCSFDTPVFSKNATTTPSSSFGMKSTTKPAMLMNGSYTAFAIPVESPNHGERSLISGQEDAIASPFGWHDTDGQEGAEYTITRGNNVWAAEDRSAIDTPGYSPDGGQDLIFDFPFDRDATILNYQDASITNLFYMNNITHDIWYKYGFDEASGNFQQNNYGRGGQETDAVDAYAQDGSDTNNATFGTPVDGRAPVMSMFLWNPQTDPNAEGSFVINNSSLAGIYNVVDNAFTEGHKDAPRKPDGITADLVLAIDDDTTDDPDDPNDACSALVNASELVGKIAVVRRGTCTFVSKVQLCQDAGALAVIVVNDDRNPDPEEMIPMGGELATIDIPAVMINRLNGDPIIAEISNVNTTVNATLSDPSDDVFAVDGSFDNGIIAHEYGHGISNRLVGGPSAAGCLQTSQSPEQMGEGWSDWFALMMTVEPGDTGTEARGIGTFAIEQPTTGPGIRPNPYSTDMIINPVTYADTNDSANYRAPHGIGSIWASILWDMTWAFVDRDGYDADLYNGAGGNNLAMQLVIDGLKLTSCSPGFVDGRDGILAAADLLPNSDANKCIIWEVFARRGVGFSADQGTTGSRTDQTEAFDLPPNLTGCQTLGVDDISAGVFRIEPNPARNGTFSIRVSENIGDSTIAIFDMNGRVVFEKKARLESVYSINSRLTAGVYVVKIVGEDNTTTGTFKVVME